MDGRSIFALAAAAAALWAGNATAETEAEYAMHPPAAASAPAPRVQPRAATFAPDAAKTAARLPAAARDERAFVRAAAAAIRFETEASKLVSAKSKDPRVRAFAQDLIEREKAVGLELTHLLHVRGMALPMMDNHHRKMLKNLGKLSGTRFDRAYMEEVGLKYQREDIRQYEKISTVAVDPSLKSWVDRELVTLRGNLLLAQRLLAPQEVRPVQAMGAPGTARPVSTRPSAPPLSGSNSR